MAWTVDTLYGFTRWLVNKNQAGGISATDLFYSWNAEQRAYQSDLLGRFQAHSNGKEGANTGLIENQTILGKLLPFTHPYSLTIVSGAADKPTDWIYTLAIRRGDYNVFKVNHNQLFSVANSSIDPPNETNNIYYYVEYENYYSFLPSTITTGGGGDPVMHLDYISEPVDVVWGYTLDGDGRQVYDATSSTQPQWGSSDIVEITKRVLKSMGVHFTSKDFEQYGNSVINTGN